MFGYIRPSVSPPEQKINGNYANTRISAAVHVDGRGGHRAHACDDIEEARWKNKKLSPLFGVAMETVSSHAFELLHNGQEVLAAFLDVALLFFQLLLLVKHFLLHRARPGYGELACIAKSKAEHAHSLQSDMFL